MLPKIRNSVVQFMLLTGSLLVPFMGFAENPVISNLAKRQAEIDSYIENGINLNAFPGAQLVVGSKSGILYSKTYGYHDYEKTAPVEQDDIYDIASCTKIMSATISVMRLIGDGKLNLTSKLGELLPEYKSEPVGGLTLAELLKHTSGLSAGVSVARVLVESGNNTPLYTVTRDSLHPYKVGTKLYVNRDIKYNPMYVSQQYKDGCCQMGKGLFLTEAFKHKIDTMVMNAYTPSRRGRYKYSDLNFYFVGKMIERASGESLDKYTEEILAELDIANMGFKPLEWKNEKHIMPTEFDCTIRRDTLRGYVHDEFAASLGGVSGNSGLFANAESMAKMCQLFLNYGKYNEKVIIPADIVKKFTSTQVVGAYRGYGFDKQNPASTPYGASSYGHTGFTGTYFWVDPTKDVYVVLLTNRVYPSRQNNKLTSEYRSGLWTLITE